MLSSAPEARPGCLRLLYSTRLVAAHSAAQARGGQGLLGADALIALAESPRFGCGTYKKMAPRPGQNPNRTRWRSSVLQVSTGEQAFNKVLLPSCKRTPFAKETGKNSAKGRPLATPCAEGRPFASASTANRNTLRVSKLEGCKHGRSFKFAAHGGAPPSRHPLGRLSG